MERIDIRYALAEVARDKRFVESLQWRSEEIFFARENLAACVVDGTYSIKIWTWLMKWKTYQGHEFEKCSGPSVQALPLPSRVSFSRARFFFCPLFPSACYAGYFHKEKFLRFRNPESLHEAEQTQSNPVTTDTEGAIETGAPNGNFRENICSEDDLRSRIFGAFVVKFLACLLS